MLSAETRKQMVSDRCAHSSIWRGVHALGSLDLAILAFALFRRPRSPLL